MVVISHSDPRDLREGIILPGVLGRQEYKSGRNIIHLEKAGT